MPQRVSAEDRFWKYTDKRDAENCWVWTGSKNTSGYGRLFISKSKSVRAHRFSYELHIGPIPEGMCLDHLCRVRHCVNPHHLQPTTIKENVLRGEGVTAKLATKTHCKNGHSLSGLNLIIKSDGNRECRECKRIRTKQSRAAIRALKVE